MAKLWNGAKAPNYMDPPQIEGVEYYPILETEKELGSKFFIHGIAVEAYKGALFTTWAYNPIRENSKGEMCVGKISRDGGKTWGESFEIKAHTEGRSASHGSLFVHEGRLWAFIAAGEFWPAEKFAEWNDDWINWQVDMELHVYNDETGEFDFVSVCAENFWPLSHPEVCANGNIVMGGLGRGRSRIAVCKGGDMTKWEVYAPALSPENASFSETTQFTQGDTVTIVTRNDNILRPDPITEIAEGRLYLGTAISHDGGNTFSACEESDILASSTKPFAGVLKDGRPYLLFNQTIEYNRARWRLLLAVGDKGSTQFNKLYKVDFKVGALSYPFAVESDGKLYAVYSSSIGPTVDFNKNNLKIAIIDVNNI